jgi:hypothetical protein
MDVRRYPIATRVVRTPKIYGFVEDGQPDLRVIHVPSFSYKRLNRNLDLTAEFMSIDPVDGGRSGRTIPPRPRA